MAENKELEAISRVLDDDPKIAELVWQDLQAAGSSKQTSRGVGSGRSPVLYGGELFVTILRGCRSDSIA